MSKYTATLSYSFSNAFGSLREFGIGAHHRDTLAQDIRIIGAVLDKQSTGHLCHFLQNIKFAGMIYTSALFTLDISCAREEVS